VQGDDNFYHSYNAVQVINKCRKFTHIIIILMFYQVREQANHTNTVTVLSVCSLG